MYQTKILYNDAIGLADFPILAIDPGKSNGIAWATARIEHGLHVIEVETSILIWPDVATVDALIDAIEVAAVVVAEDFRIYPHKASDLSWDSVPAARVLGFLEAACLLADKPLVLKMAAHAKGMIDDGFLKRMMTSGRLPASHERDALRHIWLRLLSIEKLRGTL